MTARSLATAGIADLTNCIKKHHLEARLCTFIEFKQSKFGVLSFSKHLGDKSVTKRGSSGSDVYGTFEVADPLVEFSVNLKIKEFVFGKKSYK